MAKNYAANGNTKKAIEILQGVATRFDLTPWAEKAREMIGKIEKGEPLDPPK